MLPYPLLSSVLFDLDAGAEECPLSSLKEKVHDDASRSLGLGDVGIASQVSQEVAGCFGLAIPGEMPVTVLLWRDGDIIGWLECLSNKCGIAGCTLVFHRPDQGTSKQISVSIMGLQADLARLALATSPEIYERAFRLLDVEHQQTFVRDVPPRFNNVSITAF